MRRADRLFQIVQFLRTRRLTTAQWLAEHLQVSTRTIYRDIQDLQLSGVPVGGNVGTGYSLQYNLDLPPLLFNVDELDALIIGLRIVQAWTDATLVTASHTALSKIEAVLPVKYRQQLTPTQLYAPLSHTYPVQRLGELRKAIHAQQKVKLLYWDEKGNTSERIVWPLGLFFWGNVWTLTGWCELRADFRNFRLDRIVDLEMLTSHFQATPGKQLDDYLRQISRGE